MFNLTNIPVHVNDMIFGDVSEITRDAPRASDSAGPCSPGWYFGWTLRAGRACSGGGYRRLTP